MDTTIIKLENVTKNFGNKKVLNNIDLNIQKGSIVTILGSNGAGKSTIIGIMLGLIKQTSGNVELFGNNPTNNSVKQRIGVMLQEVSVINLLTVKETINLFRSYYKNSLPMDMLLEISGLKEEQDVISTKLSGGQKRRLNFALAMCGNPDLLFLDEPTVGMDITSRQLFWDSLKKLIKENKKTVILTTHYLEEADSVSDRIIFLDKGVLIADGSPKELKAQVCNSYISFKMNQCIDEKELKQLSCVNSVEIKEKNVKIESNNIESTLKVLMNKNYDISELEVQNSSLEDYYRKVTS
ncbi:ABC transporter ATP-binding protein [Bacillus cereus]|uniref:ABC transporter ATP-binding protein n=1 Tax=Bacillus cereus TaxID=1396 RepID=UPI000BED87CB|nr:ABC transporter ATP-binding protein [Bacillus cereus]PEE35450.1 ABC transporter ATP-binding protein [Bacillus cereus]PET49929.1 ABC transporter ATP-binding protein [Bacillus cereus]PEV86976.1 ABC transporter ATP-binding protein [Bacillus cereus]PFA51478.1 ABC transporter ATP-binding protein [Bacillus cereus]PFD72999.1 ABC transporter ATP-binding protein [Bacillus cereus]